MAFQSMNACGQGWRRVACGAAAAAKGGGALPCDGGQKVSKRAVTCGAADAAVGQVGKHTGHLQHRLRRV